MADLFSFLRWARDHRLIVARFVPHRIKADEQRVRRYPTEVIEDLCAHMVAPSADPFEALALYLLMFHACTVSELRLAEVPMVLSLSDESLLPTLAESYFVRLSRHRFEPQRPMNRPDTRIDFWTQESHWLKPLLERFEEERRRMVGDVRTPYLFVTPHSLRHMIPVGAGAIRGIVKRATLHAHGSACTAKSLRIRMAAVIADHRGEGLLELLGWRPRQALAYTWLPGEIVQPG